MQPRFLFVCLAVIFTLTHANLSSAGASFPENLPSFSCELKLLTRDGLNTAVANRERFAKACLACIGDACAMRIWPEGYEDRETLCRNTYCLPKKMQKMTFAEGYNMSFLYRYEISPDGKATILEGTYLEGEPKVSRETEPEMSTESCWRNSFHALNTNPSLLMGAENR